MLGIPFLDVVRVLAAVLLLGNVQFVDSGGVEVSVRGDTELTAVAGLLGVTSAALFRGITSRTHNARGQLVKSLCDANMVSLSLPRSISEVCLFMALIILNNIFLQEDFIQT